MSQPREQEHGSIPFMVEIILKLISGFVVTILMTATCQFGHAVYYGERSGAIEPLRNAGITVRNFYQKAQEGTITWGQDQEDTIPHTNTPEEQGKPPEERHRELKILMLQLTNQHRAAAGVPPVQPGDNPAAQLHAEMALAGCYSAHWDRWGMKPNHRYTLTAGTGEDAENGSGSDYCIQPGENYRPNSPMETEVAETVQDWMDSPGHRRNLLDPAHTIMNAGIAHDRFNTNMVQHFSSDYVSYLVRPNIDSQGVLRLEGQVSQATLEIGDSVNIQIGWDPPLKPLTRGQLANTYALCNPRPVGYVVEPLPPNWFHREPRIQVQTQENHCVDPYQTSPSKTAPSSPEEAHQAWTQAKQASAQAPVITVRTRRITAERMKISSNTFSIRADLAPLLVENGPGIYTITLWGRPLHMSEPTPLSTQSIFWQTEPPADSPYQGNWNPEPAETKQARARPTAPAPPVLQVSTPLPPINLLQPPTTVPPSSPFRIKTLDPSAHAFPTTTTIPPLNMPRASTPAPAPKESQPATQPPARPTVHTGRVDEYSYNITFPGNWRPTLEKHGHAIFTSPDGSRGAEIRIRRLENRPGSPRPLEEKKRGTPGKDESRRGTRRPRPLRDQAAPAVL